MSVFHVAVKGEGNAIYTRQLSDDAGSLLEDRFAEMIVAEVCRREDYDRCDLYVMKCDKNGVVQRRWGEFN